MLVRGKDYIGIGVGGVILNAEKKVLLLRRKKHPDKDCWSIPGGAVEFGENVEDAVIREIKEEVGLVCRVVRLLSVTNHLLRQPEPVHWVSISFLLAYDDGIPAIRERQSHSEIGWFGFNDLPDCITLPTREAISSYLAI